MKTKEIYEPVAVMVAKMVARATTKKEKRVAKAFCVYNGYVLERLCPSGKYKVQHEGLGRPVIVDTKRAAKCVAVSNCKSE